MFEQEITVSETETASAWFNLLAAFAGGMKSADAAIAQLIWPSGFDQASAKIEFADDDTGTNGGALYDTDGTTILSNITKPAAGLRTALDPATFCHLKYARIVLPGAASADFVFTFAMRKIS